jgi:hypothetical protein
MSQTAVETSICDICGVGVRPGSEYCYNCGGSVGPKPENIEAVDVIVGTGLAEDGEAVSNGHSPDIVTGPGLAKSERSSRQRTRASNRMPVEVVWEPRTGVSLAFIIGSSLFVLIALALFIAANYLR